MNRRAILLVNSVAYGDTSKSLPRGVVSGIADDFASRLTTLEEEHRFRVTSIKDERRAKALLSRKLDQLSSSVGEYGTTLPSQEDRLQGVGWFEERPKDGEHARAIAAGTLRQRIAQRVIEGIGACAGSGAEEFPRRRFLCQARRCKEQDQ